jgi:starch synthase (maltosyl-transferring)
MNRMQQIPGPGSHLCCHRGDQLTFSLTLPAATPGDAWLRSNLGQADVRRTEIIRHRGETRVRPARDWRDHPMSRLDDGRYAITVPLLEVGVFEAKTFFLPRGSHSPLWPEGENTRIKVEPADYAAGCSIYTAFVRQFGPAAATKAPTPARESAVQDLDAAGFTVIPPSGTFRELVRRLDFIIGTLGFRIIQLLPIHPTPTTYARMGRFGSPFAALDFMDVDPALAEFDRHTTPLDQLRELADAIHARDARLFLDIPVNHTGWASWLQLHHPHWFARNADRTFQSPGAWGVTWEDLSRLDYSHPGLWDYMADVFLHWCRQGADGFRCDAGYMVPYPVWEYITARVRSEFPDTVFMLEGLGGKLETVESLLSGANLDWAYSELFQQYSRDEAAAGIEYATRISNTKGLLVHFAETHDNLRLAARSHDYARMRTALAALCSQNGAFGITSGVEWFATERIDVHGNPPLNWGSAANQIAEIARLNAILRVHPCFHSGARLRMIHGPGNNTLALRRDAAGAGPVLVLVNLDAATPDRASWDASHWEGPDPDIDLLTGRRVPIERHGSQRSCSLPAAGVFCLTADSSALHHVESAQGASGTPESCVAQALRAKALEVRSFFAAAADADAADPGAMAADLAADPRACCRRVAGLRYPPVVTWQWPRDLRRVVLVPRRTAVLVRAPQRFTVELLHGDTVVRHERSLPAADGAHFILLLPPDTGARHGELAISLYEAGACRKDRAHIVLLGSRKQAPVQTSFSADDVRTHGLYAICANRRAALCQVRGAWGTVTSQYDALLAANLHPSVPTDRRVLFTRCRAWLVCRGYSSEIGPACLRSFSREPDGDLRWTFDVPAGQGRLVPLEARLHLHPRLNSISLRFTRMPGGPDNRCMDDDESVTIILRPDIEDRSAHEQTKAYSGPEHRWPAAVETHRTGFTFQPGADRALRLYTDGGTFQSEAEWLYMIPHPFEADRGLDPVSDLFSPGYFSLALTGGASARLEAIADSPPTRPANIPPDPEIAGPAAPAGARIDLLPALRTAITDFIVQRDASLTVIAGHPWFLDWGRDTLICLRGLIAGGHLAEAEQVLLEFGAFERDGTLPNMIRGNDDSNRDTSDAPLWFFTACADFLRAVGSREFLNKRCGDRTILDVLLSIARSYTRGTPNGIRMDAESGLIFSPSHFTWMDTNHPAGSPREGYPIEIQALWHAALRLLADIDPHGDWAGEAARVQKSVANLFATPGLGYLADCLHAGRGTPARQGAADDALRPNQLLAITLGLVRDETLCASILQACEELLVPGAIRSLADRPVRHPLPVYREGRLLNDPVRPYWGHYNGDEDTRRKPAYHNGTAWTWLFPSYCEALHLAFGDEMREAASGLLVSGVHLINQGCIGHLPEIVDGDAPHIARGAGAQAWGATEYLRVLMILDAASPRDSDSAPCRP